MLLKETLDKFISHIRRSISPRAHKQHHWAPVEQEYRRYHYRCCAWLAIADENDGFVSLLEESFRLAGLLNVPGNDERNSCLPRVTSRNMPRDGFQSLLEPGERLNYYSNLIESYLIGQNRKLGQDRTR